MLPAGGGPNGRGHGNGARNRGNRGANRGNPSRGANRGDRGGNHGDRGGNCGGRGGNHGGDRRNPNEGNNGNYFQGNNVAGNGDGAYVPKPFKKRDHKAERKGPAFGFKRLQKLLISTTDETIMSIDLDIKEWQEFLESPELTAKSDTLLILVVQVLAEKVCCETVLCRQQMSILSKTNVSNFIEKINQKSTQICIGVDNGSRRMNFNSSDFVEVDTSPKAFLTNLHKYSTYVAKIMSEIAVDYLIPVVASAFGAVSSLIISDPSVVPLVNKFTELLQELQSLIKKREDEKPKAFRPREYGFTEEEENELHAMEAPDDFRSIEIIPSPKELLSKEEVFLRPNKKEGSYTDANHYLDVQFRLLREDFVQPLKKGIQDFMKNRFAYLSKSKKIPLGTIRVYPDVQIISGELVRDVFVYKVQLLEENYKKMKGKWDRSKRLLNGSLLVFTSDFFQTTYFATVANRRAEDLDRGIVSLIWEGIKPTWDTDYEYLMVECEVYFEAFRYTLQTLKELELEEFPMCKFIVQGSSDVDAPKYLKDTQHLLKMKLHNQAEVYISPLVPEQWPTGDALGLDDNQYQAYQAALTKEFAIIQGPPGTGKTFLGLKIAELFLNNQSIWSENSENPILVVCYTNHALDQFLEGLLDIFAKMGDENPSIVRVGGRCKSEKLDHFSLHKVARRHSKTMPKLYWPTKYEIIAGIDEFRNQRSSAMAAVMGLRDIQGIVNFEQLDIWNKLCIQFPKCVFTHLSNMEWFGLNDHVFQDRNFNAEEIIRRWLVVRPFPRGKVKKVARPPKQDPPKGDQVEKESEDEFEEDYDLEELLENRIIDDVFAEVESKAPIDMGKHLSYIPGFSIKECERTIREAQHFIEKILRDEKNPEARRKAIELAEHKKMMAERRKLFLEILFSLYREGRIDLPDISPFVKQLKESPGLLVDVELKKLPRPSRWALFFEIVEVARALSATKASKIDENLIHEQKKLKEIEVFGKGVLLRRSKVVGMTTTGAAKYNELVKMMQSKIVIVEEAAEVLESHIVTCITKHCEHLILIGDHRQLRPSTTVYDLAKKFNLDISLFERMINNNLNCYQLKEQHRMRPEIADLVVGTIYPELENHPSVSLYPTVQGVTKNLFFISHNEMEKSEADSMSKSNVYEAKFVAGLCRYLILQGYSPNQITVLTTYTGQMFLLKKTVLGFPNCKGVRVTVVDNFQGEENDIILLSLVRSNVESKIGFLNIDNRICVAISRAKQGLFIVGNMKMLALKSKTWKAIQEKLHKRAECGPSLVLECQIHGTLSEVKTDNDFMQNVPQGGCNLPCETILKCTHACQQICHVKDRNHLEYQCRLPCLKKCANDHPCNQSCFIRCPPCTTRILKILPCTHERMMPCYQNVTEVLCQETFLKRLPCDHELDMACHRDPSAIRCQVEVERELPCVNKHRRVMKCYEDPALVNCKVLVIKTLPCGHDQEAECRFSPDMIKCLWMVPKTFEKCDHVQEVRCSDRNKVIDCRSRCTVRLPCGHACTKFCHATADPDHLMYICKKDCAKSCVEGHKCTTNHTCHKPCPPCLVGVPRQLLCTHIATISCHIDPTQHECVMACDKELPCQHKCQNLCFQGCGPCQIPVQRKIPECRHTISVPCNVTPSRNDCFEPVKPLHQSECKHDALVPCAISQTATHAEVMKHCEHPCKKVFDSEGGCGHKCKGTCKTCRQGRFHEKCQEKCERPLVCGHLCEFPCSNTCPPCGKKCAMRCEHSECTNKCGVPCQDCNEKCPWQCVHKKCSKLCREKCDREPCDETCQEVLACGHSCIGFCGEACPSLCRICDEDQLKEQELFDMHEGDGPPRFVFLADCKHSVEVNFLTGWMNVESTEIGVKRCPICSTVVRFCRRFGNVIRERNRDVMKVKTKIFGSHRKIQENQSTSITKLRWDDGNRWSRTLSTLQATLLEMLAHSLPAKPGSSEMRILPKPVDAKTLENINLIINYAESAIDILLKAKLDLKAHLYTDLIYRYRELFQITMNRKFPLSQQEFRDISQELDRLLDLYQVYWRRSSPQFTDGHSRALPIYDLIIALVLSPKPYTDKHNKNLIGLLKELEDILRTGLGISEKEKREVLSAMGFATGHWFSCPNGHIYAIGDCGGARQVGRCNECGAEIGGTSYQLARNNTLAQEMDGATAPRWPTMLQRNN